MSTERFPIGLDSLIPETYKTQAESFAQCLRHKLLSLRGIDETGDSHRNESRKRLNNVDCQVDVENYTNPTTLLSPSSYSNNNNNNNTSSVVQNKGNDINKKKKDEESLKEKKKK